MKACLHILSLAVSWSLVVSKEIKHDAALNTTASESGDQELGVDTLNDDEMPFSFMTIKQSYEAPENATGDVEGLLSVAQLRHHAKLTEALAKLQVEKFGTNWTLTDFCFKLHLHKPDDKAAEKFYTILEHVFPCSVVSALDCFVEGAFIHGPYPPVNLGKRVAKYGLAGQRELDWASLDPVNWWVPFQKIAQKNGNDQLNEGIANLFDVFEEIKVIHGWTHKLCLDPENPRCPATAENKDNRTAVIDVGSILGSGCTGLIESVANWEPEMFLDGFVQNIPDGPITNAESLVTTILLSNASYIFNKIIDHPGIKSGLDESAFVKAGVTGVASLISEWSNITTAFLKSFAEDNEIDEVLIDVAPNEEWVEASNVHEKLAQAGFNDAGGWELMFGDFKRLKWIFNDE